MAMAKKASKQYDPKEPDADDKGKRGAKGKPAPKNTRKPKGSGTGGR